MQKVMPKWIEVEIEHLKKSGIPRCVYCKKPMVNAVDGITGEVSHYQWRTNCGHNPNLRLSRG